MYKLPYFTEPEFANVLNFMKEHPFVVVTANGSDFPAATQVPVEVTEQDGNITLTGHIMKNTDHHLAFKSSSKVLVIFHGPHCYVSASWYTNPAVASTWNYMTVHAKGTISFHEEEVTRDIVRKVTDTYEGTESPASFDKLPAEYVDRLVKAIVGFTIEVESIDNVFKLSQNHQEETRRSIVDHLYVRPDEHSRLVAKEIEKRLNLPQ